MKSAKFFVFMIVLLYAGLFYFDYLKATAFPVAHSMHGKLILARTFFLIFGGSSVIWLSLPRDAAKRYLIVYASAWIIYYSLRGIDFILKGGAGSSFVSQHAVPFYLTATQLFTPFPFLAFWLLNRLFESNQKAA